MNNTTYTNTLFHFLKNQSCNGAWKYYILWGPKIWLPKNLSTFVFHFLSICYVFVWIKRRTNSELHDNFPNYSHFFGRKVHDLIFQKLYLYYFAGIWKCSSLTKFKLILYACGHVNKFIAQITHCHLIFFFTFNLVLFVFIEFGFYCGILSGPSIWMLT